MFKLLNRFAWLISFCLGLLIFIPLSYITGYFIGENFLGIIIPWVIFSLIIKKLFLSENFINSRLKYFLKQIYSEKNLNIISEKTEKVEKEKLEILEEEKIPKVVKEVSETQSLEETIQKKEKENAVFTEAVKDLEKVEKVSEIKKSPSKLSLAIQNFFKENLLAKIGSMLVFLGVLFLLSLIWNTIPSIGKLAIGFLIGFGAYFIGVFLDKKDIPEGKILLGTGILINFLVILGGKYLLGKTGVVAESSPFLSTSITFFLLILNTIFAIITSLIYKSKTLLIFSFLFAYLNPFLLGESSSTPYILVGYSLIVSLGALFLSHKQKDLSLSFGAFILGNILFLVAPFSNEIGWITKFVASSVLGIITLFSFLKIDKKEIYKIFIGIYVFSFFLLSYGISENILSGIFSYFLYLFGTIFVFGISIFFLLKYSLQSLTYLIFIPFLLFITLIFGGAGEFLAVSLALVVLSSLFAFSFIVGSISIIGSYIFFGVLGFFIMLVNSNFSFIGVENSIIDFWSFIVIVSISLIFFVISYMFSRKKDLKYLYPMGTITTILMIFPVINFSPLQIKELQFSELITIFSIISIVIFALLNSIFPFFNKQLIGKNACIKSLLSGTIFGILFVSFELYFYGNMYFPGIILGFAFALLAIYYFFLGFIFINKIGFKEVKENISLSNTFYTYIAISISIFTFAIALIFANNPEIIASVWIFEASVLFFLYNKAKEKRIFDLGLVIFIIGILKLFAINANTGQYIFLIPASIMLVSLFANIKFLANSKDETRKNIHDIVHIIGILAIFYFIKDIIISNGHGFPIFSMSLFLAILGIFYTLYGTKILKWFFVIITGFFSFAHIGEFDSISNNLKSDSVKYLIILQYISTAVISGIVIFWNKFNKEKIYNYILNIILGIYLLVILSIYIYDLTQNTFLITIFWGIVGSLFLIVGIGKDKKIWRTIGLYYLTFVIGKIFLYDIWFSLDNAISRVIVFIVLGMILIVVSIKYSKKYGNDLLSEFNIGDLFGAKKDQEYSKNLTKDILETNTLSFKEASFYSEGKLLFKTKAKNLLKIAFYVMEKEKKTHFEPNELKKYYNEIANNFDSELSPQNLKLVKDSFKKFVEKGGKVKLK